MKKIFKLDMNQFMDPSQIPLEVRMRLKLNELGMRFEDDGKPSAIINLDPKPLGVVKWDEPFYTFGVRFYSQELPD